MSTDEIALLRARAAGQEYAEMVANVRALVERAAAAIRVGDHAVEQAVQDMPMSVLRAIRTAEIYPALRIAHAVAALPQPPRTNSAHWGPADATIGWLQSRRSEHTQRAYLRDLSGWLGWLHEHGLDPLQATRPHVDTYLVQLRERDPAPSAATLHRTLSTLSSWYSYLVDADVAGRNPVRAVDRPPLDRDFSTTVGLTVAEVRALLRAADTAVTTAIPSRRLCALRNRALLGMLAGLGLRVGEAIALDVTDLAQDRGHHTVVVRGTGGRRRQLPIPPWLHTQLQAYLNARRRRVALHSAATDIELWQQALDPGLADADFAGIRLGWPLFVTDYKEIQHERRLRQNYVYELVQRLAREAGLAVADRISPHSLRHSAATAALDDGAALRDMQDFLGHADPRTTCRYDNSRELHQKTGRVAYPVVASSPRSAIGV